MTQATDDAALIGRERFDEDVIAPGSMVRLAATLDRDDPPPGQGDSLPPGWHWLYFLAAPRGSALSPDGRGAAEDLVPAFPGLSRMWAGGLLTFHRPLRVGETAHRRSRLAAIERKESRAGPLVFVTVEHRIAGETGEAVVESQRLVFREPKPYAGTEGTKESATPAWRDSFTPDAVMLFRFSALTFNGHRIHYDRAWATDQEGYPGLVVHGPLTALLLLDLVRRHEPERALASFSYRASRPLFVDRPLALNGLPGLDGAAVHLWAEDDAGVTAMAADVTFA